MRVKLVRESLFDTRFTDGPVDIVKDMRMGMRAKIDNYLENEKYNKNYLSDFDILEILSRDTSNNTDINRMIRFILNKSSTIIDELTDNSPESNDVISDCVDRGIIFIDTLPDLYKALDLDIIKNDENTYTLYINDISDLVKFIKSDAPEDFLNAVLTHGAGYDFFSYDTDIKLNDITDEFSENEKGEFSKILKVSLDLDIAEHRDIDEFIDYIETEYPDETRDLISYYNDLVIQAQQDNAYEDILRSIKSSLNIKSFEYNESESKFHIIIDKMSMNDLFLANYLDDRKIKYIIPYNGYDAYVRPEDYIEYLKDML